MVPDPVAGGWGSPFGLKACRAGVRTGAWKPSFRNLAGEFAFDRPSHPLAVGRRQETSETFTSRFSRSDR